MGLPSFESSDSGKSRYAQPSPFVYVMVLLFQSEKSISAPLALREASCSDSWVTCVFTWFMSMNGALCVSRSCAIVRGNVTSLPPVTFVFLNLMVSCPLF